MAEGINKLDALRQKIIDGWNNFTKGVGSSRDTTTKTTFEDFRVLRDHELASMYAGDGWHKKVVSVPAGSMIREWISISNDADSSINNKLEKLDTKNIFRQALTWQRLFRGGLVWMVSSKSPETEYKENEKIDIKKLLVFSASEVRIEKMYGSDMEITPGKNTALETIDPMKIGEVETFKILKNRKRKKDITVHASQCLSFRGEPIPSVPMESFDSYFTGTNVDILEYEYWGMSVLQSIFNQLANYGIFENGMGNIASELIVGIYKIAGLREILQADDGPELIAKRMEAINVAKSMIHAIFLDAEGGEEFFRNTANLAGVPDLWDRFMMSVSGVTNIPASKLFGRQASGLNNKGEQDERNYNDSIVDEQGKDLDKNIHILLSHLEGKHVAFKFNNPWAPSQAELITMRKEQSEIDERYINGRVLSPGEVRTSRFDGKYSFETELSDPPPEEQEGDDDLPELEDE